MNEPDAVFTITPTTAGASKVPAVQITFGDQSATIPCAEARELAFTILEGSYAAEFDALVSAAATQKYGLSIRQTVDFLAYMREKRDEMWEKRG